jgi:predicted MFS family arabinose efflux permease
VVGQEVVFSGVAVGAAGLAAWAWTTPGVPPAPSPGARAVLRALTRRDVLAGFWVFSLPALFAGALEVLVPLHLDELGASGAAIGVVFLVAAGVEAMISPTAGRLSDRHGRLAPIRAGLAGAVVMAVLLPLPHTVLLLAAALVVVVATLGTFWAPAMALLSDASDRAGLDQALAFSIGNVAWSLGHMLGGGGGGALADGTSDALVYGLLGAACAVTLAGVVVMGRGAAARSSAAR